MDYKSVTLEAYEKHALEYNEKNKRHFEEAFIHFAEKFLTALPGKRVLDVGAGPGYYAAYFREHGYEVVCIDICKKMIAFCRAKGLDARLMDLEELSFPDKSFDGVWAYASLLHVPKSHAPAVITRITNILRQWGVFGLALKEGSGEQLVSYPKDASAQRFFSYYTPREIEQLVTAHFGILHASTTTIAGKDPFLKYVLRGNYSQRH